MTTLTKYTLLQIPGWLILALLLTGLCFWIDLPPRVAVVLFALWVAKDFALYPFVRTAYDSDVETGSKQLVGARGVAQERLTPHGYVHVHGELWRAKAEPSEKPIASGTPVRVQAAHGMTLIVTADKDDEYQPVPDNPRAS